MYTPRNVQYAKYRTVRDNGKWALWALGEAGKGACRAPGVSRVCGSGTEKNARNRGNRGSKWENEEKLVYMGYKC